MKTNVVDYGPPPFCFFNSWLLQDGIDDIIKNAIESYSGGGLPYAYLAGKLKAVKQAIKKWRRVEYEKELKELKEHKQKVEEYDRIAESRRSLLDLKKMDRSDRKQKIMEIETITWLDLK